MADVMKYIKNAIKGILVAIDLIIFFRILFDIGDIFINAFMCFVVSIPVLVICAVEDGLHPGENIHNPRMQKASKVAIVIVVVLGIIKVISVS